MGEDVVGCTISTQSQSMSSVSKLPLGQRTREGVANMMFGADLCKLVDFNTTSSHILDLVLTSSVFSLNADNIHVVLPC